MSFGSYVHEERELWLKRQEALCAPLENLVLIGAHPSVLTLEIEKLREELRRDGVFALENAQLAIVILIDHNEPSINQAKQVRRTFDSLLAVGDTQLHDELRKLRPDPFLPPTNEAENLAETLTLHIKRRLAEHAPKIQAFNRLFDPKARERHLVETRRRRDEQPWPVEQRHKLLREKGRIVHLRRKTP